MTNGQPILQTMPAFTGVDCIRLEDGRPVRAMMMLEPFAFALADHYDDTGKCVAHGGWVRGPRGAWLVQDGQAFYVLGERELMTCVRRDEIRRQDAERAAAAALPPPTPLEDLETPAS